MESLILAEEFSRAKAPLRADWFGDTLVGPTILRWGTEEQKSTFIPKILRGEISWCQGFSEPDTGSDLASLRTSARLEETGDEWVINGQKTWTTRADEADYIFLLARTEPESTQAPGPVLPAGADAPAGRRGPPYRADGRGRGFQRGVLHRRPRARKTRSSAARQRPEAR